MSLVSPVFEQHYKAYLSQLADLDLQVLVPEVGGRITMGPEGQGIEITYFNRPYRISPGGITDGAGRKPEYDTCIILCRYLVMAGERLGTDALGGQEPDDWAGFRDLKNAGPLTVYFKDNVEQAIAAGFAGKTAELKRCMAALNGYPPDLDVSYDLAVQVDALPKIPMVLLFNDAEEFFPPECTLLFERQVETYLDAECIAMLGYRLARQLKHYSLDQAPGMG